MPGNAELDMRKEVDFTELLSVLCVTFVGSFPTFVFLAFQAQLEAKWRRIINFFSGTGRLIRLLHVLFVSYLIPLITGHRTACILFLTTMHLGRFRYTGQDGW